MTNFRILLTTTSTPAEADIIAVALVERRLAACVNILPGIRSVYRWKNKIDRAEECLLIIKTAEQLIPQVQQAIRDLHSYDLPECIVLPILTGSTDYLAWLAESLQL